MPKTRFFWRKNDDLTKTDLSVGIINAKSVVSNISFVKRFLAVNFNKTNMEQKKMNMQLTSLLFDLETENVVKQYRNANLYFTEDGAIKYDYGNIWDKRFKQLIAIVENNFACYG